VGASQAVPAAGPDTPAAGPDTPAAGPDTPAAGPDTPAAGAGRAGQPGPAGPGRAEARPRARRPDDDAVALWEALDRGVDLTDTADGGAEPAVAPARAEES